MRFIRFFFIFLSVSLSAQEQWKEVLAGGFSAEVSFNTPLSLKEDVVLTLTLTHPPDFTIDPESLRRQLLQARRFIESPFQLRDETMSSRETPSGLIQEKIQYVLEPQRPGELEFSFFKIMWSSKTKEKKAVSIYSPVFKVDVTSIQGLSPEHFLKSPLAPLIPRMPLEVSDGNRLLLDAIVFSVQNQVQQRMFPWGALVAFFTVGIGLILGCFYLKKRMPQTASVKWHQATAAVVAKRAIRKLQKGNRWSLDSALQVLRSYIQDAYEIRAPHLTTEEFLQKASASPLLSGDEGKKLAQFLTNADKFRFGSDVHVNGDEKEQFLEVFTSLTQHL